jgi:hypothetical protein
MRYRENEVKNQVAMELQMVKGEKERMAQHIRDYESKIQDLDCFKLRLEKQQVEDIERFKTEYQRQFKEQDFDIHRRRLAVDEDEHRITLEKERLTRAETRNAAIEKELDEIKTDYKDLSKVESRMTKENVDYKD